MGPISIKNLKKLRQKKYRDQLGIFVVEGLKGVEEAVKSGATIVSIFATEEYSFRFNFETDLDVQTVTAADGALASSTDSFSGLLAVVKKKYTEFNDGHIIALDNVTDPGNVGTIIRTADWYGVSNILFSKKSVDAYNPKLVRSTMGSIFRAEIENSEDLRERLLVLKQQGYTLVALGMDGKDISGYTPKEKTIFVMGSESHGVRPEIQDLCDTYTIPGKGGAESLNVAVAAGIALHLMT